MVGSRILSTKMREKTHDLTHTSKDSYVFECLNLPEPHSFFFSSRRRHTRWTGDWSSDVCFPILRTARLGRVVAFKTFLRTLLHEICHHLDFAKWRMRESFHTQEIGRASCRERV